MKLKTYIIPDFRTIEVRGGAYCGQEISLVNNETAGGNTTGGNGKEEEEDDAGAAIFRDGIWDEE